MEIITQSDPSYIQAKQMVNGDLDFNPFAIIKCLNEKDVIDAVKYVVKHKKEIKIRGGRHSYSGLSSGNQESIIIDIGKLDKIVIAKDDYITVGGGCQLYADIYKPLWNAKKSSIPAGSCPTVGIGGLATGGGFSFSGRKYGLTCDSIVSLKIILQNGDLITVSENENADLFWACRGAGGGNFGIITEITFRTFRLNNVHTYYLAWDWGDLHQKFSNWYLSLLNSSDSFMPFFKIGCKKENEQATLTSFGQVYDLDSISISKYLNKSFTNTPPTLIKIEQVSGIEAIEKWAGIKNNKTNEATDDRFMIHNQDFVLANGHNFYADSVMIKQPLTKIQLCEIEKIVSKYRGSGFILFDGHANGYSSKVDPSSSAYAHRDCIASVQIYASWLRLDEKKPSTEFVDRIAQIIRQNNSGAYVNYSNPNNKNWFYDYFGDNGDKLIQIKRKYDPKNHFRFPQSIPIK